MSSGSAGLRQARVAAFAADHEAFLLEDGARAPDGVLALRRAGMALFAAQGLPSAAAEDWRWTSLQPVVERSFHRPQPTTVEVAAPDPAAWRIPGAHLLVLLDGRLAPALSSVGHLPAGVRVMGLAEALRRHPDEVLTHLGRLAQPENAPFVALANAFLLDGAYVRVPRGVTLEQPVQILALGTAAAPPGGRPNGAAVVRYPRTLVVLDEGARATVLETYAPGSANALTCAVTEAAVGAGAELEHTWLQDEDPSAIFMGTAHVRIERDGRLRSHHFTLGACLSHSELHTVLDGSGAAAVLRGLYLGQASQHMDVHLRVEHAAPYGTSEALFKGILDDHARAVFNGRIHVRRGAEKTDATQSNGNLLLSRDAEVHSIPQLEILADDVRCTHGSTVGQLDTEALFYLRSRGIDLAAARNLLIQAFAADVLADVTAPAVRERVERALHAVLA